MAYSDYETLLPLITFHEEKTVPVKNQKSNRFIKNRLQRKKNIFFRTVKNFPQIIENTREIIENMSEIIQNISDIFFATYTHADFQALGR